MSTVMDCERLILDARELALIAGAAVLEIYAQEEIAVDLKDDHSPLTIADRKAHSIITEGLKERYPDLPVVSEEGKAIPSELRRQWHRFWLVDPLDGTKEFLSRNGEFTINIALIEDNAPIAGVVYAPVPGVLYWGIATVGAWKEHEKRKKALHIRTEESTDAESLTAVGSRSHPHPREEEVFRKLGVQQIHRIGSSLKFCLVAEGTADLYYRASPVWEWDTAAGDAIVRAVGGQTLSQGQVLQYNKLELLHPDGFVCVRNPALLERYPLLASL